MGKGWGMGETEERPESLLGPTRWRAEGWGRAGVWTWGEQRGSKATHGRVRTGRLGVFAGDSPDIGCGSDLGILTMCVYVLGGQRGEEKLTLGGDGIHVCGRLWVTL